MQRKMARRSRNPIRLQPFFMTGAGDMFMGLSLLAVVIIAVAIFGGSLPE